MLLNNDLLWRLNYLSLDYTGEHKCTPGILGLVCHCQGPGDSLYIARF